MKILFTALTIVLCTGLSAQAPEGAAVDTAHKVFMFVEIMPQFPGGDAAMMRFLSTNINYPQEALEKGIEGTVYTRFVVGADGKVGSITIQRGLGGGLSEEVVRVLKMMPQWKPGTNDGKAVAVYFNLPVRFELPKTNPTNTQKSSGEDESLSPNNSVPPDSIAPELHLP